MKYIKLFEDFNSGDIKVPINLGESKLVLDKWTKNQGDYVRVNETICEIATDKVNYEVSAELDGILHIYVGDCRDVLPGQVIGKIVPDVVKQITDKF